MTKKKKLAGILAAVLVFGMLVVGCDLDDGDSNYYTPTPQNLTIANNTGESISTVHLREPGTLIWSGNIGSSLSIANGGTRTITVPNERRDSQNRTDIQIRTSNGNTFTKLSHTYRGTATFTSVDLDNDSPRTITIGNATGGSISTVHLREPGTLTWSGNIGSSLSIANGGTRTITIPRDRMDNQHRADIQLRAPGGATFTMLSQTITHNQTITFTASDSP